MFRRLIIAGFIVVMCSPAFGQQYVEVFVTGGAYPGDISAGGGHGQAGGDFACTDAANKAGLAGTWTAWLGAGSCVTCMDPRDRILDSEYRLLDGTVVANNKADLLDGTLDAPINMDQNRNTVSTNSDEVWTGTGADGTGSFGPGTCTVWTTNSSGTRARIGFANATDDTWTDAGQGDPNTGGQTCDSLNRLYCFADGEVPVELQKFSVE